VQYKKSDKGDSNPKSVSTLDGSAQGLRNNYAKYGHETQWVVLGDGTAAGNPLIGNPTMKKFRMAHLTALADAGLSKIRATPLTPFYVYLHAERFWHG